MTTCIFKKLFENGFTHEQAERITKVIDSIGNGDIQNGLEKTALLTAVENDTLTASEIINTYHRPRKKRELSNATKQRNAQKKIQAIKEQYNLTDDIIAAMLNQYKDGNRE